MVPSDNQQDYKKASSPLKRKSSTVGLAKF